MYPIFQKMFYSNKYEIKCMDQKDLNAIIQKYNALHVMTLQSSETRRWNEQDQCALSCLIKDNEKLVKVIPFDEMDIFHHLRELSVSNCTSLVEVFESEGILDLDAKKKDFELVKIELNEIPKLMHIWKGSIGRFASFTNLREISISECHILAGVLPASVAENLVRLQHLRVEKCNMIEEIVIQKDEKSDGVNNKDKLMFPELKELYLEYLPNLRCFCSAAYNFELSSCDDMVIVECPNMTTFSRRSVSIPKLSNINLNWRTTHVMGNLNSTIHYIQNAGILEVCVPFPTL